MTSVYFSGVVEASADEAWNVIRQFDGLPLWHPLVKKAVIEDAISPQEIGAIRRQDLSDGSQVAEKLVAIDEKNRSYTYEFVDAGNIPVEKYHATIKVIPITDLGHCLVEWYGDFDSRPEEREALVELFTSIVYQAGIYSLKDYLGRACNEKANP